MAPLPRQSPKQAFLEPGQTVGGEAAAMSEGDQRSAVVREDLVHGVLLYPLEREKTT
jgi:hypothetical protein